MKTKILSILCIGFVILMTGCNNWKYKFALSDLKVKDDYIVGKIKNKTDTAYDLVIKVALKNGSLVEEKTCKMILKPNEVKDIKCLASGYEEYNVNVSKIEYQQKKISTLKNGEIDKEILEYYFEDIYEQHTTNFISFILLNDDFNKAYPYIDKIKYEEQKEIIKITGAMGNLDCIVSYGEEYNASKQKLNSAYILIKTKDNKLREDIISNFSLFSSFGYENASEIRSVLNAEESGLEKCYKVGSDWCVSSKIEKENNYYFYSVFRQ